MYDNVNHPKHYTAHPSGVEAIEICEKFYFNVGNAIKYLFRRDHKLSKSDDTKKAHWYLSREANRLLDVERWATLTSDARYEVSSLGRVRWAATGRLRRIVTIKNGYGTCVFSTPDGHICRYVHSLVAEAFLGPRPANMDVAHGDGNRMCNAEWNLRYATRAANMGDKLTHGTSNSGERNGGHVLSAADAQAIKELAAAGRPAADVAKAFGVSRMSVCRIWKGESWKPRAARPMDLVMQCEPPGVLRDVLAILSRTSATDPVDVGLARDRVALEISQTHKETA